MKLLAELCFQPVPLSVCESVYMSVTHCCEIFVVMAASRLKMTISMISYVCYTL